MSLVHVIPLNDFREHELSRTCWCEPQLLAEPGRRGPIMRHNAADHREEEEAKTGRPVHPDKVWQSILAKETAT